ncbi:Wadjet anti-phage system protein JetD domain-containing protein [Labrys monachus]|uniref:Wadjet anti-phage system protein JetD domain-containing protein n=1 Tax=Labrys monachus TaxID=217067 RepID=UPI003521FC22
MRRFTDASALVADLLDRHEARGGVRLLAHVDYHGFRSIADQDDCLAQLQALERAGGVVLKSERSDGAERILHVRLADADVLYRHLGRSPAARAAAASLAGLRGRADLPDSLAPLLDEVQDRWSRNVGWSLLRPGQSEALSRAVDLAAALARRANAGAAAVDYRTFSRRTVGDSKALELLATAVVDILARLFPDAVPDPDLEAGEVLSSLGVTRLPQPFLASGALTLDGHAFPDMPYVGVPPEIAHRLTPARPVDYVLTIENHTSFVRHAAEINAGKSGLVIYTGGFPARTSLAAMVELAMRAGAPVFHWGDIDPGGLRIFVHLERALRERGLPLMPHLMDAGLLRSHGQPAGRPTRRLPVGKAGDSALGALWDMMAGDPAGLELEQEALDPSAPRPGRTGRIRPAASL